MSTGSPVSGVDTISSVSHGHGHRPSRGRGHSRSNRWSHGPISHSVSSLDPSAISQPLSQPPETANGSLPDAHGHGHRHTHSHASSIHENGWAASVNHVDAFHTHAPKHSHTGSITGLIPDTPLVSVDPEPTIVLEGPAGIIAALPWIALSWYYQQYVHWESPAPAPGDEVSDDTWTAPSSGRFDHTAQRTGFLTAATIIFLGCAQVFQVVQRGESMPSVPTMGPNEIRSLLGKVCSVALPIYASLKVGGFLVAFALLLATASGLPTAIPDSNAQPGGQARLHQKKLTAGVILTVVLFSFLGMNTSWDTQPFLGYFSLLLSVFIIRPPFSTSISSTSASASGLGISVPGNAFDAKAAPASSPPVTPDEAALTTGSGVLLALATAITSRGISFGAVDFVYILLTAGAFAASLVLLIPSNLRSPHKIGLAIGTGTAAFLCAPPMRDGVYLTYLSRGILAALAFPTARFDDKHLRLSPHSHHHHSHGKEASQLTNLIIRYSEPYPLLYSILKESDSRRIFYFMTLNFSFMLVQLSYGFITGSLGLLSDSIHMFFDCLALVVGLCAAVMSKWPPSSRFPYGYGKVDTLSGFANGIFLMIISIEIIYEAVERLSSGSQMHRLGELLVVSIAGLLVNLVGIMAFDHAHHGHGHDHHGHSHGNENMHGIFLHILADTLGSVAVVISTVLVHYSGWAGYDPIASCMIAILIFASAIPLVSSTAKSLLLTLPADVEYNVRDTLGGVSNLRGVVGYTVPKFWLDDTAASGHDHHHGHGHSHGHDHSHGHSHGHSHDHTHGHNHDHCHDHSHSHSHNNHSHSQSYDHSHAHSHGRDHDHDHDHEKTNPNVLGVIHVIASRSADLEDVRQRTVDFLREKNMDILVQVEREGDGRCWCGGGNKSP